MEHIRQAEGTVPQRRGVLLMRCTLRSQLTIRTVMILIPSTQYKHYSEKLTHALTLSLLLTITSRLSSANDLPVLISLMSFNEGVVRMWGLSALPRSQCLYRDSSLARRPTSYCSRLPMRTTLSTLRTFAPSMYRPLR